MSDKAEFQLFSQGAFSQTTFFGFCRYIVYTQYVCLSFFYWLRLFVLPRLVHVLLAAVHIFIHLKMPLFISAYSLSILTP